MSEVLKGYEISYKKPGDSVNYVYVIGAKSKDDAMLRHHKQYGNKYLITNVQFLYKDIQKEFYDVGDKHGWD